MKSALDALDSLKRRTQFRYSASRAIPVRHRIQYPGTRSSISGSPTRRERRRRSRRARARCTQRAWVASSGPVWPQHYGFRRPTEFSSSAQAPATFLAAAKERRSDPLHLSGAARAVRTACAGGEAAARNGRRGYGNRGSLAGPHLSGSGYLAISKLSLMTASADRPCCGRISWWHSGGSFNPGGLWQLRRSTQRSIAIRHAPSDAEYRAAVAGFQQAIHRRSPGNLPRLERARSRREPPLRCAAGRTGTGHPDDASPLATL